MLEKETHNSAESCQRLLNALTPEFLEAMDYLECNNGDTDWYVRMPIDPPLVDPKARKLPGQCEERDATLELGFPMIENWLLRGSLERKRDIVPP